MSTVKSTKLIVNGIVQRVGYRNKVYRIAKELGIKGYVKNLNDPDESVEILAQTTDQQILGKFIERINIQNGLIVVKGIHKSKIDVKPLAKFEIIRDLTESENAERLDIAAYYLEQLTNVVAKEETTAIGFKQNSEGFKHNSEVFSVGLNSLNQTTTQNFNRMDAKYGKIGDKLESISHSLEKLVDVLQDFKTKFSTP